MSSYVGFWECGQLNVFLCPLRCHGLEKKAYISEQARRRERRVVLLEVGSHDVDQPAPALAVRIVRLNHTVATRSASAQVAMARVFRVAAPPLPHGLLGRRQQ